MTAFRHSLDCTIGLNGPAAPCRARLINQSLRVASAATAHRVIALGYEAVIHPAARLLVGHDRSSRSGCLPRMTLFSLQRSSPITVQQPRPDHKPTLKSSAPAVQYRYTDQLSPISENFANLLICNYFLLLQPSLSFAPLTQTEHLTQRLKIPLRKECRFDSGPGHQTTGRTVQ